MSEKTNKSIPFLKFMVAGVMVVLVWAYWSQRQETHRMREEMATLRLQLDGRDPAAQVDQAGVRTAKALEADTEAERQSVSQAAEVGLSDADVLQNMVMTPTGMALEPRNDGLALVDTSSTPSTGGGIHTVLKFDPTISGPLGVIAVVVRLPKSGAARIVDLAPGGNMKYSEIFSRVSEDGKFGVFQIETESLEDFEITLTVTEPVVADVRGTCGIGPYDLTIGDGNAVAVRK